MQIRQEKGKHTNGPYWMRVWVKVHVKEEVTQVVEGPAPPLSCDAISRWEGGASHLYHLSIRTNLELSPPRLWELNLDKMMSHRPETPVSYLCLKEIIWGGQKRNLKEYDLPLKWREILKHKNTHYGCSGYNGVREGEGAAVILFFKNGTVCSNVEPARLPAPGTVRTSISPDSGN